MMLAKKALKSGKGDKDEGLVAAGAKKLAKETGKLVSGVAKRTRLGQRIVAESDENGNGLLKRLEPFGKAASSAFNRVRGRRT